MATQNCDKFDKIKNKDNRDFKLAIPLHENDPSYAKDISNDVSISFLDSAFNFFVELEKSAFKSVVYSHGKGLELKHPAGLMNFSVPNIQVIETAARRTRISESDKNNIASYKVSFTSPTNQLDSKSKDGDQFDYSKFPFCKRPNLEDFTLDITNSNSNERITAQNYLLYQKPGFIPKIPCPKIISDEEIANLSEIEANIKKARS
ncbi:unnamed protein product [Rhizophagus irregularis]|nr:unnamed protein product [Rhizophagus irregularis]